MASRGLFRALLLAASLGWNGVFAQDAYNSSSTTTASAEIIVFAPQLGVSQSNLDVPTITTSSSPSIASNSSYSTPPIAYSPATGHTEISLDVPTTSVSVTVAPLPVIGHTESSLVVPTTTTTSFSRSSRTFRRPTTENTRTSLDVPPPDGDTTTIAHSPATGHTQTSLDVPTTTVTAPIVVTAKSRSELEIPTGRPTGGLVATISLPPDQNGGYPVHHQQNDDGPATETVNVAGIIASLAHEHGEQWNGGDATTAPPSRESAYSFLGTQIAPGASAVTVDGTTYSLAPSGEGVYINGQETTLAGPSETDSIAVAIMSALGVSDDEETTTANAASSTLVTSTSNAPPSGSESGSSSAGPAQQTGNNAALVLPGVGLGGVGLLMALL